jgi:hypothetical protein
VRITAARLTRGRTLAVRIRCATTADTGCAGVVTARLAGRRIGRARYSGLARGRTRTVRLRLSRESGLRSTRRRLVLSATVRDATGPAAAARRSFQARSLTRGG